MDYISNRLKAHPNTKQLGEWYANAFSYVNSLSRVMMPTLQLTLKHYMIFHNLKTYETRVT